MERSQRPALSDREKQLIELAAQGLIDTAIAARLGISEATVSTYWGRVRVKLGPFSRTELVAMVLKEESERALASLKDENEKLQKRLRLDSGEYKSESNFYKDLLEIAADAMIIVNRDGIIENANEAASSLFGYDQDALVGMAVIDLMPERFRHVHDQHRADYLGHPEKRKMGEHMATIARSSDGREFPIAASLSALEVESGVIVLCIIRPVSLV